MPLDQQILHRLNEIGIALSKEERLPILLEKILTSAKELTQADGGTIYTVVPEGKLHFEIAISTSLGFHLGGTSNIPIPFLDLPLFLPDGSMNDSLIVAYAVNHKTMINIKDAYYEQGFDFTGTRRFDEMMGYRTKSVLTVPIYDHEGEAIAVLQLINPSDGSTFSEEDVQLAESLASQAGVALTNQLLITSLRNLFESLIRVIAEAIDEKSPETGNHGKRVPIITLLLAEAVNSVDEGPLKGISFTPEELYELKVAAFLHDCGKITTPVYIVEKQKKLEAIFDRIELIQTRYSALLERSEKEVLAKKIQWFETHYPQEFSQAHEHFAQLERELHAKAEQYQNDQVFVQKVNSGEIKITDESQEHLKQIAQLTYVENRPLLTTDELDTLCIFQGNLSEKERGIIEHHVVMSYRMLSQLNFPKGLRHVPEIVYSHHERIDGKGYPRGLKRDEILLQARILTIADIFEALSAPDRSYRKPLPLSQVFKIMQDMVDNGHLDPDLYDLFLKKKAYLSYAKQFLAPEQIDC